MNESHGLDFAVDTSGIAGGLAAYRSAVDGIFSSLDKFEKTATRTFEAVNKAASNKANLSSYAKSMEGLGKLDIDTSAARKIKNLSDAVSGFKAPNPSQAANLRAFFKSLSNLPDLSEAASSIRSVARLSASLSDFKAPSATQAANLRTFFKSLSGLPDLRGTASSIQSVAGLSASLSGFKAPSPAASANLTAFAKAASVSAPMLESLGKLSGLSTAVAELNGLSASLKNLRAPSAGQVTNLGNLGLVLRNYSSANISGLSRIGTAISGISNFKAPTPAQIRNLTAFVDAVDKIKVPQNASQVASALNTITSAATRANTQLGGLRGGLSSLGTRMATTSREAHEASLNMMGLQNAFSGTFQVGSVLRSLLGSLTLGELGRSFFEAAQTANQFAASMEILSDAPGFKEQMWDRATQAAAHFGAPLAQYTENFSKFAVAAKESGVSVNEATKIFEGFQTVQTALHLGTQQQDSVGLALREMMDRGYVSTTQLTRQLGMVLPGAIATLQTAWKNAGKSQDDLFTALKKKEVDSQWALDVLATHYSDVYGKALPQALKSPIQQFNILRGNVTQLMIAIGNAGATKAFSSLIGQIAGYLDPTTVKNFATAVGHDLATAVDKIGSVVAWLHDNWDSIKTPLGEGAKLLGEWMAVSAAWDITRTLVNPLIGLRKSATEVIPKLQDLAKAYAALNAVDLATFYASLSQISSPTIVANVTRLQNAIGKVNGFSFSAATLGGLTALKTGILNVAGALMNPSQSIPAGLSAIQKGISFLNPVVEGFFSTFLAGAAAVGTGLVAAFGVAADQTNALNGTNYTTVEIMKGTWLTFTDWLSDKWNSVTSFLGKLWADWGPTVMTVVSGVGTFIGDFLINLTAAFQTTVSGIAVLWRAAFKTITDGMAALETSWGKLKSGDIAGSVTGLLSTGVGLATGKDFGKNVINGFVGEFQSYQAQDKAGLAAFGAIMGARGRGASVKPTDRSQKPALPAQKGDTVTDPIYHGSDGGGDASKAADKALNAEKAFESAYQSFLSALNSGTPVDKLWSQWDKTLSDGAKALLGQGGYNEAIKAIRDNSQDASKSAQGLINALNSGQLSKQAAKYMSPQAVQSLIADLKQAVVDQDDKVTKALVEMQTKRYAAYDKVVGSLGDHNPVLKVTNTFDTKQLSQAGDLLNPQGMQAYLPIYDKLRSGAMTAAQATQALITLLNTPGDVQEGLAALIPQITGALLQQVDARNQDVAAAKLQEQFGYNVIKSMQDERTQLTLSANQQDELAKIQQALNDAKSAGLTVTQANVNAIRQEIEAQQQLTEAIKQANEAHDSNGIRQWAAQTMQGSQLIDKLDNTIANGLEQTLTDLGTKGTLSFKNLINTMQSTIIQFASQSLVKQFMNGFFGKGTFDASGKMSGTATPSFFNGFDGQKTGTQVSSDKWAGMSGANDNALFNPQYDKNTGLLTAVNGQALPQQTQAMTTAFTNSLSMYANNGALNVNVINGLAGAGSSSTGLNTTAATAFGTAPSSSMDFTNLPALSLSSTSMTGLQGLGAAGLDASTVSQATSAAFSSALGRYGSSALNVNVLNQNSSTSAMGAASAIGALTGTGGTGLNTSGASLFSGLDFSSLGASSSVGLSSSVGGLDMSGVGSLDTSLSSLASTALNASSSVSSMGSSASQSTSVFGSLFSKLTSMLGLGGGTTGSSGGGLLSGITSLFKSNGNTGLSGVASFFGFREGGTTGSPVGAPFSAGLYGSGFHNAPHFAEGTSNTGLFAGGMPAILHQNEAVIPLSRGRAVPVEFSGSGAMGDSQQSSGTSITFNVTSANPDTFRRSQSQMSASAYAIGSKANRRNG